MAFLYGSGVWLLYGSLMDSFMVLLQGSFTGLFYRLLLQGSVIGLFHRDLSWDSFIGLFYSTFDRIFHLHQNKATAARVWSYTCERPAEASGDSLCPKSQHVFMSQARIR